MAFLTFSSSSSYAPLATAMAAARTRLPGAARPLLLGRSGAASGGRVAVAAVLPAVGCARAAASARTRCTAGDQASPSPTAPEPLTLATLVTLVNQLRYWLTNPPKCNEDFKKIEITTRNCMDLCKRMIEIIFGIPGDIHEWIATIGNIDTTFVELHNQSRGENPWADTNIIEAAIKGLIRLAQISLEVSMALASTCCTAGVQVSRTPETLTVATFATLVDELCCWLTNPPKCKKDFKKIEITASKCKDLFPRLVHDFSRVPADILKEITDINGSIFVKLHNQSRGEDPKPDVNTIEAAIKGVKRMGKIFLDGAPGLTGYTRP